MNWTVPKLWVGGDVWIIGGGPSITKQFDIPKEIVDSVIDKKHDISIYSEYMKPIHDKHVIGINVAYMIGNWIDAVFFGDNNFFLKHKEAMYQWPGLKISCASNTGGIKWVKTLLRDRSKTFGISNNSSTVGWNGNSGAAAISVAANAGAKRIFLLGFDMKLDSENLQHWHSVYRPRPTSENIMQLKKGTPFHRHLRGFPAIANDANKRGIEIINVNPESAIESFNKVSLIEALSL